MNQIVMNKIQDFFGQFPLRHYRAGDTLLQADDNPTHIFYLESGRVKQYDISDRGDEMVLNAFKPPAYFPMSYAINRTPNEYFYEAESDTAARLVPLADALAFVQSNPDVLYDLLARVYQGTDGLLGRLAHLMSGSAHSRVLYELYIESQRFGQPRGSGVAITIHESDIGAHAGLARETVSREIHKLKQQGLISVHKGEITIQDPGRLAALLDQTSL
jgi:CRP-like cAMP-binding protein